MVWLGHGKNAKRNFIKILGENIQKQLKKLILYEQSGEKWREKTATHKQPRTCGDGGGAEGLLQGAHQVILILLRQLVPTRHKGRMKQLASLKKNENESMRII